MKSSMRHLRHLRRGESDSHAISATYPTYSQITRVAVERREGLLLAILLLVLVLLIGG